MPTFVQWKEILERMIRAFLSLWNKKYREIVRLTQPSFKEITYRDADCD